MGEGLASHLKKLSARVYLNNHASPAFFFFLIERVLKLELWTSCVATYKWLQMNSLLFRISFIV